MTSLQVAGCEQVREQVVEEVLETSSGTCSGTSSELAEPASVFASSCPGVFILWLKTPKLRDWGIVYFYHRRIGPRVP